MLIKIACFEELAKDLHRAYNIYYLKKRNNTLCPRLFMYKINSEQLMQIATDQTGYVWAE